MDLKPSNLLLTGWDFNVVICDFGLSVNQCKQNGLYRGNINYRHPYAPFGIATDFSMYNQDADVFAATLIMLEIVIGHRIVQTEEESIEFSKLGLDYIYSKYPRDSIPEKTRDLFEEVFELTWSYKDKKLPHGENGLAKYLLDKIGVT